MPPTSTWRLRPPAAPDLIAHLTRAHQVQPIVALLLHHNGITPRDTLHPTLELAPLPNLQEAAQRLASHIRAKKRILLHGDYDADGITGSAILTLGLRELGATVDAFIPNRITDGYGMSPARVDELAERADVLVTIDCGITGVEETRAYQERGLDVIITDHHSPKDELPDTLIVHPDALAHDPSDPIDLTGAGVAYHLLWATRQAMGNQDEPLEYADIAAIGTIADVAHLTRHNRALVQTGLARMRESSNPGVRELAKDLKGPITSTHIGFKIAPRINAAGRLGEADTALDLLTTRSEHRAGTLATYLGALNDHRRAIQDTVTKQALERANPDDPAIVLEDATWHPGVIGIAAAKVVETLGKGAFLSAGGKGSVRVPPGMSALRALERAAPALIAFGGHEAAAGFTVDPDHHAAFATHIHAYAHENPATGASEWIDAILHPNDVSELLLEELHVLEPHGQGNPAPTFGLVAPLHSTRVIGKDKSHLQIRFAHDKPAHRGVAWGRADLRQRLVPGTPTLAIASLNINEWNGNRNIEFTAKHLQEHQPLACDAEAGDGPRITRASEGQTTTRHTITDPASAQAATSGSVTLRWLPDDPHEALALLTRLHEACTHVHYGLAEGTLDRLERNVASLLTREALREHMLILARTAKPPQAPNSERCQQVLRELDLLTEQGHLKRETRNPYDSVTLLADLVARYQLHTLITHYRHADVTAFQHAACTLLATPTREPVPA